MLQKLAKSFIEVSNFSKFIIINGTKEVKRCEFSTSGLPSEYFKQFTASETFKPSFKWW